MPKQDDHWFKFFYKKITMSCQGWKDDEFGAYVKLLIHQFDRGALPDNEKELSRLITSFKKNWPMLSKKFAKGDDGLLRNDFMTDIRNERDEKSKKFSEFGKKGGRPTEKLQVKNIKPEGFEKKTYKEKDNNNSLSYSSSNSLSQDRGMGEEEDVGLSPTGFWLNELPKNLLLTDMQIGSTTEFIRRTCKKALDEPEITNRWEAFKIQHFGQRLWKNSFEELLQHFRNSLKFEIEKNGQQKTSSRLSKTSGVELAINTALSEQNDSGDRGV